VTVSPSLLPPGAVEPVWRVHLLGGLQLGDGRRLVTRLPSRAVTALLARLAMAPERLHAREELIEMLWPGVEPAVGRNRLRQALSTLKSQLESPGAAAVLQADRLGVRVVPGALACDVRAFEAHVRAGRHAEAAAAYRGELLPGFYDEWIHAERQRLATLFEQLPLQAPAVAARPGGAPAAAAFAAKALLPSAPALSEPALPLRKGEDAAPARVVLPSYLTRMFGAKSAGAALRQRVLTHRLVTLIGPGGAGKTRLAVEVAHSLRDAAGWPAPVSVSFQPFGLIAFVPLLSCSTRAQVLDALQRALQIQSEAHAPLDMLVAAIAGRRALLVLDNFEQLVGVAEDVVAALLSRLPALHVIVSSRRPLGIDGEEEWPVPPLPLPAEGADLAAAAANPAVALFVERARAVRSDFHLHARNSDTVAALVRALEGMPLAIELAASRVRSIAPADMLQRLAGPGTPRLELLARSGPRGAVDARHASMQRAIEWSWDQLDPASAAMLSALTVFEGSFSAAAALALVSRDDAGVPAAAEGAPLLGAQEASRCIDELVAVSLLTVNSADETWRFGMYQPIREFAASRLAAGAARHHRARLRRWAQSWVQALPPTPPMQALRQEMPNLCAALASAVQDGVPGEGIELLLQLRRCLEDVALPGAGLQHAVDAVAQCADPLLRARGHSLLGPLLFNAGQGEAALHHAGLGLQCAELDAGQRARALHALARVRWRSRRRADEVEPLLEEALALAGPSADADLLAGLTALRAFVTNAHHRDRVAGERLHAQALALWERLGNRHAINSGRYNLAVCAMNDGRNAEALARIEPVIAAARELQDWRRLSQAFNVRGNIRTGQRDWAAAVADYQDCIRIAWEQMAVFDLAHGLWNLPRPLARLRQPERAARLMSFAAHFWRTRFGDLADDDRIEMHRVQRLVARQIDLPTRLRCEEDGERLELARAVALALA
jgi:predicted ATPase